MSQLKEEAKILTLDDLATHVGCSLTSVTGDNFLVELKDNPALLEEKLKAKAKLSHYLKPHLYKESDFDKIWSKEWIEKINFYKFYRGFFGYKLGQCLVTPNGNKGKIIDIDISPECLKPIGIKWEIDVVYYNLVELKNQNISQLIANTLGTHVYYETGETNDYYKVFIGIKSKKLAQQWLRRIKNQIGELSHLHEFPVSQRPTKFKYHYELIKPKQKRMEERFKNLRLVAIWDLSQPPNN